MQFIVKFAARPSRAGPQGIAPLDHEPRDDAMEDHPIIEWAVVLDLAGAGIGPVFFPRGQADEIGDRVGSLVGEEFAFQIARGGVDDGQEAAGAFGGRRGSTVRCHERQHHDDRDAACPTPLRPIPASH